MTDDPVGAANRGTAPTADALDGRTFAGDEAAGHSLVPGSAIEVSFADGNISVHAGCNRMFGSYSIDDGVLRAPQLASTMMACDQQLMDQDRWLAGFLGDTPRIALDAGALSLSGSQNPPAVITLHEDA